MMKHLKRFIALLAKAAGYLLAIPPYTLGWLAGLVVKTVRLGWAAVQEGFRDGGKI